MIAPRCRCGAHPEHGHKARPETLEEAAAREAALVSAWCGCGVYLVAPIDVGRNCDRCVLPFLRCGAPAEVLEENGA